MNRRNFIKLCGVGVSGVLFAQLLPGCASDTAETAQILTSKSLTDSQREAIRNQLVECLDLTSNIGQYAEYPNLLLQHRGVLIITGYEFIEDSQLLKSWAANYMIEFRAEAYVRFNFDFYKSKTTITSVATPWTDIYKLKTARPGEWMTIAKAPTKTIRYPIRIAATSPTLLLDSGRRLPCVMTLESFLGFINPKSQNISNYIR